MSDDAVVMPVLLAIREDIGSIKATIEGLPERVNSLELAHANQKGRASVWHMVSAAIGGGIGAAATFFSRWHVP